MTPQDQREATTRLRQRLWFLRERLKDATHDPALSETERQEKVTYYIAAITEARGRLLDLAVIEEGPVGPPNSSP